VQEPEFANLRFGRKVSRAHFSVLELRAKCTYMQYVLVIVP
jgi:hypothetical protein